MHVSEVNRYRMVCNFREGFIFAFFASQEPFAKIKTTKFLLSTYKASELGTRLLFSPHWNKELRLPSLSVDNSRDLFSF